jgi:gas vesicle protein
MEGIAMNEQVNSTDLARGSNAMMGFIVGAAVGAGIALLFAPCSGIETRKRIGSKARDWGSTMGDKLQRTGDRLSTLKGDVQGRLTDLKDDVKTAVASGKDAFVREREQRNPAQSRYETPATTQS